MENRHSLIRTARQRTLHTHIQCISGIKDFDEAIRLKPDFAAAYYNRSAAKLAFNQVEEAEYDLQTALKLTKQQGHDSIKTNAEKRLRELNATE